MEYENPSVNKYTIYTKSGCVNCIKAKRLLAAENPDIVDCDDYLIENRDDFMKFMNTITKTDHRVFPMIFRNGEFIGGYAELKTFYAEERKKKSEFPEVF